jgi:[acyl-carrier-protein] S-malonyltransferase
MPEIAFLFPGQGSQVVGMVEKLANYSQTMEIFSRANRHLGFDLYEICLHGPAEKLAEDLYAQLAIHVTNCAYAAILADGNLKPKMGSGFSLGIFSALAAAGALTFEQGLNGVRIAAEEMSREGIRQHGAMAAVIGLSEGEVEEICRGISGAYVASVNTAQQIVLSGREESVLRAMEECQNHGALLVKRLPIGWAIHTPLMKRASQAFSAVIKGWEVSPPRFPVLSYLRGERLKTPQEIKEEISNQFSQPNRWYDVLQKLIEEGIDTFVEVGPGDILSQMVRWVKRSARAIPAERILQENLMKDGNSIWQSSAES